MVWEGASPTSTPLIILLPLIFFFSSRRRHTRLQGDWSSDVCSSDLSWIRVVSTGDVYTTSSFSELHHAPSQHPHPTGWTLSWGERPRRPGAERSGQPRCQSQGQRRLSPHRRAEARAGRPAKHHADEPARAPVVGVRSQTHRPHGDHEGYREREQWSRRLRGAVGV